MVHITPEKRFRLKALHCWIWLKFSKEEHHRWAYILNKFIFILKVSSKSYKVSIVEHMKLIHLVNVSENVLVKIWVRESDLIHDFEWFSAQHRHLVFFTGHSDDQMLLVLTKNCRGHSFLNVGFLNLFSLKVIENDERVGLVINMITDQGNLILVSG